MTDNARPRRVRAKIRRTVFEIAFVVLDRDGNAEEYEEHYDELDMDDLELIEILDVLTVHP